MKIFVTITLMLLASTQFTQASDISIKMNAMIRNKFFHLKERKVDLPHLISNNSFDGKHFKIVQGKKSNAIKFTNQELRLKAATTYYHLEKARQYFVDKLNSSYVKSLPKIIIRIEHINNFNELGHFAHDHFDPQYNNALTIPAGNGYEPAGITPWNHEIWFRPAKKIHLSEIDNNSSPVSLKRMFQTFRSGVHMTTVQKFLMDYFILGTYDGLETNASIEQFIRTAGTSIILEAALSQAPLLERLMMRKWYLLDSALVPEIIYHEFAHIALSDYLELNHSTAVIEGMADFFAGQIADSKELATKVKKYNSYNGKKVDNHTIYRQEFELTSMANTDYLFGLLWQINDLIGDPALIYNLRTKIKTDSNIRDDLLRGIFELVDQHPQTTPATKLKLHRELHHRGI